MAAETNGHPNGAMLNGVGTTPPSSSSTNVYEELLDKPLNQEMLQVLMTILRKNGMQVRFTFNLFRVYILRTRKMLFPVKHQ